MTKELIGEMKLEKRFFFWRVLGLFAIMLGACIGDEVESLGGAMFR